MTEDQRIEAAAQALSDAIDQSVGQGPIQFRDMAQAILNAADSAAEGITPEASVCADHKADLVLEGITISPSGALEFMGWAAEHFTEMSTHGHSVGDIAANAYNAKVCQDISKLIRSMTDALTMPPDSQFGKAGAMDHKFGRVCAGWDLAMRNAGHTPAMSDGFIDMFYVASNTCNGPGCVKCGWSTCRHCHGDKPIPKCECNQ